MKTKLNLYYLLFVCLFTFYSTIQNANATHIVGSDITYKCTSSPGVFEVTLVLYRKCDGGAAPLCGGSCGTPCTQTMSIKGADPNCSSTNFSTITLSLVSVRDININSACPGAKNACDNMGCVTPGTYTPAIERYEFTGFANIGATSGIPATCCNVRFVYELCCRSSLIATGAADANFYIDAIINRCLSTSPCNSSPVLTNDPIMIVCGGENVVVNNGAVDPDLDSMSYSFTPALSGFESPVPYNQPFSYDKPMPWTGNPNGTFPAGIHCDPNNGDIKFTPPNSGSGIFTGVVAVEMKQWKFVNGKMNVVGITHRDFLMMVRNDCLPNNLPRLITSPPSPLSDNLPRTNIEICAGEQFCFTVTAKDTDFNPPVISDTTYLSWNAALASFGATFRPDYDPIKRRLPDSLGGGPREDRYQFCWTPTNNMANSTPYYFTVSAKDNRCPNPGRSTTAFSITVSAKPSVSIQHSIDACGVLHVSFTNNTPKVQITSYLWDISPLNDPQKHYYYENINAVTHAVSDTGLYSIKLVLTPGNTNSLICSDVTVDTIRAVRTSLIDSLVISQPTCSYFENGKITVFATNGDQPYQYSLNQGAYSATHSFTSLPVGHYNIRIKDASGCIIERNIELKDHKIIENGISGVIHVNAGDTQFYSSSYATGATPIWTVTNGTILHEWQNPSYIMVKWGANGTGEVKLIVLDSNCIDTAIANITIGNAGITKIENPMGIKVYPNPTQSVLNIQATMISADTRIEVYNILGKLVLEKELETSQQLNLESFPNGLYFVKIGDWNTSVVKE